MRTLTSMMLTLMVTLAGCASSPGGGDGGAAPMPLPIVELIHGDISGIEEAGTYLIKSSEDLAAHRSATLAALKVDFSMHSLVLLAMGQRSTGGYWARITQVSQAGDTLIVVGQANRPGPDQMVPQMLTSPYCVAVIPATTASRLRADVTSLTGQTPPGE